MPGSASCSRGRAGAERDLTSRPGQLSLSLDPLSRPQSVFALQKELARETERRYTKLSFSERLKLQLENLTGAKA